jgi:hypothetical protein
MSRLDDLEARVAYLENQLASVVRAGVERYLEQIHTMLPAKVTAYDPLKVECDCEVVVQPPASEPWPPLKGVPVGWLRGGGYAIHAPLAAGDHVTVLFAEKDFSQWRLTGQAGLPAYERPLGVFPIAIPSIGPLTSPLGTAVSSASGLTLAKQPAGPGLVITSAGVEIGTTIPAVGATPVTNDTLLQTTLGTLLTWLNAHTHPAPGGATSAPTPPLSGWPALTAALALKSQ